MPDPSCSYCGRVEGATETCLLCMAVRLNEAAKKLSQQITAMQRIVERMGLPP